MNRRAPVPSRIFASGTGVKSRNIRILEDFSTLPAEELSSKGSRLKADHFPSKHRLPLLPAPVQQASKTSPTS